MSPRRPAVEKDANYTTPALTGHNAAMARQIGEEVRRRGLSQREFAAMVEATEERISLVLRCIRRADPATLDRWARALGMCWHVELIQRVVGDECTTTCPDCGNPLRFCDCPDREGESWDAATGEKP